MINATLRGKPDAGNPHVRFDEGEVASAQSRRGSLLYNNNIVGLMVGMGIALGVMGARAACGELVGNKNDWIRHCRELALRPAGEWIGATESKREYKQEYEVLYHDSRFLSFRCVEWWYEGGAHGNSTVKVGSFSRKTGKILKLSEVVAADKMPALRKCLYDAVVKRIGGEKKLQGEVTPIENFYVAKDGLHFVFNAYEVACFAIGVVDVVVPMEFVSAGY